MRRKAIVKYPGSKWGIAKWIVDFFPEHHSYLEPFFGSGAVLFNKPRSHIETVNDWDGDVVNLFEWIKKDPERLAKEIYYTPYARQVYEEAFNRITGNSLYRAVNFCIRLNMGHGFRTNGKKVGWKNDIQGRERGYAAKDWTELPERLTEAAERLRGVQIECRPAVEVIQRFNYNNVLIYADPPYLLETRCGKQKQYRKEMTDKDHAELLEVLKVHKGPAVVSGYDSELYREILKSWHKEEKFSRSQGGNKTKEILWMNFAPAYQMELNFTEEYLNGERVYYPRVKE